MNDNEMIKMLLKLLDEYVLPPMKLIIKDEIAKMDGRILKIEQFQDNLRRILDDNEEKNRLV